MDVQKSGDDVPGRGAARQQLTPVRSGLPDEACVAYARKIVSEVPDPALARIMSFLSPHSLVPVFALPEGERLHEAAFDAGPKAKIDNMTMCQKDIGLLKRLIDGDVRSTQRVKNLAKDRLIELIPAHGVGEAGNLMGYCSSPHFDEQLKGPAKTRLAEVVQGLGCDRLQFIIQIARAPNTYGVDASTAAKTRIAEVVPDLALHDIYHLGQIASRPGTYGEEASEAADLRLTVLIPQAGVQQLPALYLIARGVPSRPGGGAREAASLMAGQLDQFRV